MEKHTLTQLQPQPQHQHQPPINDIDLLEKHLLFMGIDNDDLPRQLPGGRIHHKIDANNIHSTNWSALQSMLSDVLHENSFCQYELRIYNTDLINNVITLILSQIQSISLSLNSTSEIIKMKQGIFGIFFEILFTSHTKQHDTTLTLNNAKQNEVKIGAFGEESSGKSTTLSVIINEAKDDGNGSMRKMNFRFQHEFQSGRTLSISHLIFGLTDNLSKVNITSTSDIVHLSKLINLYDMGGSEKAMKNTLSLISPDYIDYALLFVDVSQGFTENSKILHILNNSIHIPIITVVTMIDKISQHELDAFLQQLTKSLTALNKTIQPIVITSVNDITSYTNNINSNIHPIIPISNVTGHNVDILMKLIVNLPNTLARTIPLINKGFAFISSPYSQFDVHEHFIVEGKKTVIGGVVSKGSIRKGESYYFGPNKLGNYKLVTVMSIHCKKRNVDIAYEGQFSSLCLSGKNYDSNEVRKGMCLIGVSTVPKAIKRFTADIWSIGSEHNVKEVKYKYEPVVIINHIRQTCKIKQEKKNNDLSLFEEGSNSSLTKSTSRFTDMEDMVDEGKMRKKRRVKLSKDKDEVFFISRHEKIELMFEFKNTPEYITEGQNVIINDSNIKAMGIVTKVFS
jgi:GTPase